MKILTLLIIIIILLVSCKKNNEVVKYDIKYEKISKIIIASNSDSINGICKQLIFKIILNNDTNLSTILTVNTNYIICDGINNVVTFDNSNVIIPIDANSNISETLNWTNVHDLNINDFAGKGEKFIGYRINKYPEGIDEYYYGWIKIKLSQDRDSLTLISRALNQIKYKNILTNQKN